MRSPLDRFRDAYEVQPNGCWRWTASENGNGYGQFHMGRGMPAHRASWLLLRGPIPRGMALDHLCHTNDEECLGGRGCAHRRCVNPDHLEIVTREENWRRMVARRRACPNGHRYEDGSYVMRGGTRRCVECSKRTAREGTRRRTERYRADRALRTDGRRPIEGERLDLLVEMVKQGRSRAEIAEAVGCATRSVWKAARRARIDREGAIPQKLCTVCGTKLRFDNAALRCNAHRRDPVKPQETCLRGHPLSGDNLYRPPSRPNVRRCVECARTRSRERARRLRAQAREAA